MGRIAAIDYGLKRIGLAISDLRQSMALPWTCVEGGRNGLENVVQAIRSRGQEIEAIVVGLPLLMSGKTGDMALAVQEFARKLQEALSLPVHLFDERLSSIQADRALKETSQSRKDRSKNVDSAAAALLLQSYLDCKK